MSSCQIKQKYDSHIKEMSDSLYWFLEDPWSFYSIQELKVTILIYKHT